MSAGESGRRFLSSYCLDQAQWEAQPHQAVLALQGAMESRSRKSMGEALAQMQSSGIDLNAFILQDTHKTWFNLGSYFLSRGSTLGLSQLDALMERPSLDLDLHQSRIFNNYARKDDRPPPRTIPFVHTLMVSWGEYIGFTPSDVDKSVDAIRARAAAKLMERMSDMTLDWNRCDSEGSSVIHALFRHADGAACKTALPWLIERGVDPSVINDAGHSPADYARHRLSAARANQIKNKPAYEQALAMSEEMYMGVRTAPSETIRPRGPRL